MRKLMRSGCRSSMRRWRGSGCHHHTQSSFLSQHSHILKIPSASIEETDLSWVLRHPTEEQLSSLALAPEKNQNALAQHDKLLGKDGANEEYAHLNPKATVAQSPGQAILAKHELRVFVSSTFVDYFDEREAPSTPSRPAAA